MPKRAISKETVETRSYGKKLFYGQIPEFLGSPTYIRVGSRPRISLKLWWLPNAKNRSNSHTISLITYTIEISIKDIYWETWKKVEDVFTWDQFGVRRERETRDAVWMLRIMWEKSSDIGKSVSYFKDWQKAPDLLTGQRRHQECEVWKTS